MRSRASLGRVSTVFVCLLTVSLLIAVGLIAAMASAGASGTRGAGTSSSAGAAGLSRVNLRAPGGSTSRLQVALEGTNTVLRSSGVSGTGSSIPIAPSGAISLRTPGGALSLTPLGVVRGADVGQAGPGQRSVVFRGSAAATDTTVVPQPDGGVEISETLGSASAPSSFSWVVKLAGIEQLAPTTDGGVNIVEVAGPVAHTASPAIQAGSVETSPPGGEAQASGGQVPRPSPNSYPGSPVGPGVERAALPPCDPAASASANGGSGLDLGSLEPVLAVTCTTALAPTSEAEAPSVVTPTDLSLSSNAPVRKRPIGQMAGGD